MPEPKSPLSQESLDDLMWSFEINPDFWRQIFDPSFYETAEKSKILNIHKYIATLSHERDKFHSTLQMIVGLQTHMHACLIDPLKKQNLILIRMVMDGILKPQGQSDYLVLSPKFAERDAMLRAALMQFPSPPEILKNPLLISISYLELYNKCRRGQDSGYNEYVMAQNEAVKSKTPVIFGKIPIASSSARGSALQFVKSSDFSDELNRSHLLKNIYPTIYVKFEPAFNARLQSIREEPINDAEKQKRLVSAERQFNEQVSDELLLARLNYRRWRDEYINNKKTSLMNIINEMFLIIEIAQDTAQLGYVGTQKAELDELLNETLILLRKACIVKAANELGNQNAKIGDVDKLIAENKKNQAGKKIELLIVEKSALLLGQMSYSQRAKYINYFEQLDNFTIKDSGCELSPAARFFERDKLSVTYTVNGKTQTSEFGAVKVNKRYQMDYPNFIQLQSGQPIIWPQDKMISILNPLKSKRASSRLSIKMVGSEVTQAEVPAAIQTKVPAATKAELIVSDIHFTYPELDVNTQATLKIAKELNKYVLEYPMLELTGSKDAPKPLIELLQESITTILTFAEILRELETSLADNPSEKINISKISELALFRSQAGSLMFTMQGINIDSAYVEANGGIDFLNTLKKIKSSVSGLLDTEKVKLFAQNPLEELFKTLNKIIDKTEKNVAQPAASNRRP